MRSDKENIIVTKTFNFALEIINFSEMLFAEKRFSLANQIFKAGTSEAQNAESKADFIHKMKISAKEADETEYWLLLCKYSQHLNTPSDNFLQELKEIQLILYKIISTSKT